MSALRASSTARLCAASSFFVELRKGVLLAKKGGGLMRDSVFPAVFHSNSWSACENTARV